MADLGFVVKVPPFLGPVVAIKRGATGPVVAALPFPGPVVAIKRKPVGRG